MTTRIFRISFLAYLLTLCLSIGCDANSSNKNPSEKGQNEKSRSKTGSNKSNDTPSQTGSTGYNQGSPNEATKSDRIPAKVFKVLSYVKAHGEAMPGYVGGRTFQNRERRLPRSSSSGEKIRYQEWDVNPKRSGQNRGAERLITASDQHAYFTDDHYSTFIQIE
jgi:ribonuclease T1